MLSTAPSILWMPKLLARLARDNVHYTADRNARMLEEAKLCFPLFMLLDSLYGLSTARKGHVHIAVVASYSGAQRIAHSLNYNVHFVDTGVLDAIPIPFDDEEDSAPSFSRFVQIDMDTH